MTPLTPCRWPILAEKDHAFISGALAPNGLRSRSGLSPLQAFLESDQGRRPA